MTLRITKTQKKQHLLVHTLIKILHKHNGNVSNVLCRMRFGVTDELTSEFPQPHHVKTSCEFNVLKKLRKMGRYNNVHRISIGGGGTLNWVT